ncbi:MAG: oligosaccharide flippase family protein [Pseudomonadota bacterium]
MNDDVVSAFRALFRSGSLSTLAVGLGLVLSALIAALLARELGPEGFGIYSVALSFAFITSAVLQFGLPSLVVREAARLRVSQSDSQLRFLWLWSNGLILLIFSLVAGGLILAAYLLGDGALTPGLALASLPLALVFALTGLQAATVRGVGKAVLSHLPENLFRPASMLVLLSLLLISETALTAELALNLLLASAVTAFSASLVLVLLSFGADRTRRWRTSEARQWMISGSRFWLSSILSVSIKHLDVILLGAFLGSAEAGIYKAAVTLSILSLLPVTIFNTVLQPKISELHTRNQLSDHRDLITRFARLGLMCGVLIFLFLSIFGGTVVSLVFGPGYEAATIPLIILLVGGLINSGFGAVAILLDMCGHEKVVARTFFKAAVISVLLNIGLIPTFGILGASIASALTTLFWNATLCLHVRKLLRMDSSAMGLHPWARDDQA